jgi:hypothetical protein
LQTDQFLFQKIPTDHCFLWKEWDMKKLGHKKENSDLYIEIVITDSMEKFFDSLFTEEVRFLASYCKEIVVVPIRYTSDCNSEFIVVDWIDYGKSEKILNLI